MSQRNLNLGTPPAGTDGDTVRQAFEKTEANFTELYQTKQDGIEGLTPAGISFLQAGDAAGQRSAIDLGNVDNTSDADKPVSTAQQAALDAKQDTLIAGDNITIIDNVISSTGGGSGSTEWGAIGGNLEDQIDLQNALNGKVDTVAGKGLSTNDFTDDDKARLNAGTDIAQGNRTGTEVVITSSTGADATLSPATATLAGLMSAADKTKVDGMPSSTDGLAEGATNLYFTAVRVRSTLLTGLVAGTNAVIAATDTILQALAKLQAQVTVKLTNPMTSPGDLILGGSGGAAIRLPIGNAGQNLRVNATGDGLEYASSASSVFVSPQSSWVANGELTFSHGLGRIPNFLQIEAVCTVAVGTTPVGTRFKVDGVIFNGGAYRQAQVTFFDASTVRIRVATSLYRLRDASGAEEFSPSNSQIVLRCM